MKIDGKSVVTSSARVTKQGWIVARFPTGVAQTILAPLIGSAVPFSVELEDFHIDHALLFDYSANGQVIFRSASEKESIVLADAVGSNPIG